jgi:hypothetical protein
MFSMLVLDGPRAGLDAVVIRKYLVLIGILSQHGRYAYPAFLAPNGVRMNAG